MRITADEIMQLHLKTGAESIKAKRALEQAYSRDSGRSVRDGLIDAKQAFSR